jgi:HEAT repeat protein
MRRRLWLSAVVLLVAGCSSKGKSGLDRLPAGQRGAKRPKGPQTMGGLLLASYVEDLKSPTAAKRIKAAEELGNMGQDARSAIPALEKLASDKDAKVSKAAKSALTNIRKR